MNPYQTIHLLAIGMYEGHLVLLSQNGVDQEYQGAQKGPEI